jgi:hypothetical protein
MNMDISLPQGLLLLSLNDATGKTEDGYYQPALAGAALADLMLRGAIELQLDPQAVIPLRHGLDLGAFLGMCDQAIGGASKPQDLGHWVSALGNQKDFVATLADELCHLGALSREKTKVFGLFTRTVWPEASPFLEAQLKQEMADAMFNGVTPIDERLCLTIALAKSVGLLEHNFEATDLSTHVERIDRIAAGDCLTTDATEAVLEAVNAAIRAANAVADSTTASIIT